jgi:hypothetical protein
MYMPVSRISDPALHVLELHSLQSNYLPSRKVEKGKGSAIEDSAQDRQASIYN